MNRRTLLRYAGLAGIAKAGLAAFGQTGAPVKRKGAPIVLYCDLPVDPAREQEMLHHFHSDFKPVAEKFEGYIDLKMLKLRTVIQGGPPPPKAVNYRFQLTYESEELRQKWIASAVHQQKWPLIENTLVDKGYLVLLADSV